MLFWRLLCYNKIKIHEVEYCVYINTDKMCYERIKALLPDIKPDIKITLVCCDDNLEKMGFCSSAPCIVCFDLSLDELEKLLDDLMQIEVDAFNTADGNDPPENDPYYQKYLKYGWLWDIMFYAKEDID